MVQHKLIRTFLIFFTFLPCALSNAVTMGDGMPTAETTNERTLTTQLFERTRDGKLHTALGIYELSPQVKIDDQRPISEWYEKKPSNVFMIFEGERIKKVIIYE